MKIRIDTSLQQVDSFINSFVEHFLGEYWYPNKPNIMENKATVKS